MDSSILLANLARFPTLNNNIDKFNLSHIWDRVLLNTKGLPSNKQGNNNNNQPNETILVICNAIISFNNF